MFRLRLYAACAAVLLSFIKWVPCAHADELTPVQKVLYASMQTITVADFAQTRYIAKNPSQFSEACPLLGEHPSVGRVNTFMATRLIVQHFGVNALPADARTPVLIALNLVYAAAVIHNSRAGVGMSAGHTAAPAAGLLFVLNKEF